MAQSPQPLGKIEPVAGVPAKPPTKPPKPVPVGPPPRPTDADLEALVAKSERGGDLGDVDVVAWMAQVQAAIAELARRKATGEYGKPWVEPAVEVAATAPEPQVSDERRRYERLREQWVGEHPDRRAAYEAWHTANADSSSGERVPTFDLDPTVFLTAACTADAAKQALEAVERELREKFDAAARTMGFPGT